MQKHQNNPDPLRLLTQSWGASNSILDPRFFASLREGVHCGSKQSFPFLVFLGAFFYFKFFLLQQVPLHHTWCRAHAKLLNIKPFYQCFHYWIQRLLVSTEASVRGHLCHWQHPANLSRFSTLTKVKKDGFPFPLNTKTLRVLRCSKGRPKKLVYIGRREKVHIKWQEG